VATSVTSNSSLTPEQVAARKLGIGGSDAASVLGCNPYRSALELYELKVGLREPDPPNAQMKRGIYLEAVARRLYTELTGRKVRRIKQQTHLIYPHMICNVDGQIVGDKERGRGVLELKCPAMWTFAKIDREGLPLHYIVQMQHNLAVTGCSWGSFALFNADLWKLRHFDVERDNELIDALIVKEEQFWYQHIVKRLPPPEVPDTSPELMAQLAKAEGAVGGGELIVRNDEEWGAAARMMLEARELVETAENLKASAQDRLKALMVEKGAVEGGGIRCYWTARDGKQMFDREALEKSRPLDRDKVIAVLSRHIGAETIAAQLGQECWVDFDAFKKRGKPYDDFRVYQLRSVGVGD
jgi:putative phage-type endonuclease